MNDLPPGWVEATLGEIAETTLGKMLDRAKEGDAKQVPYLRNANVQWGQVDTRDVLTMDIPDGERDYFALRPGDLLVCEGGEIGRCAIWRGGVGYMAFQKALHRVRPVCGIEPGYLRYAIEYLSRTGQLLPYATGSTIKHLPQQQLRRVQLPLPPHGEQRRIVDALEDHLSRLDAAIDGLIRTQRNLSAFTASLLARSVVSRPAIQRAVTAEELMDQIAQRRTDAVGKNGQLFRPARMDGYVLPSEWKLASLDQLSVASTYGSSTKCDYEGRGAPVVRIPNIRQGELDLTDLKRALDPKLDLHELYLQQGDLLFVRTNGSPELIGRAAVVRENMEVAYASYLIRFRLFPGGVLPGWVRMVVSSPLWRRHLERSAATSAGQYNLNSRTLGAMPIPVPPAAEQVEILAQLEGQEAAADTLYNSTKLHSHRANLLRRALLEAAFGGRLVPQDPNDEPASVLLERIRAAQPARRRGRRRAEAGEPGVFQ
jgi:type I restriction enzyme, S subunit